MYTNLNPTKRSRHEGRSNGWRKINNKYYQGARNLPSHWGSQWNHWCHQCQVGRLLLSVAGLFFFLGGVWSWTKIQWTYESRWAEKKHCDLCFTNCFTRICCQQILRNHRVFFCLCSACSLAFWCGQTFLGRSQAEGTHMAAWSIVLLTYDLEGCVLGAFFFLNVFLPHQIGCFLKWWYPRNTPKWSFLVGKTHGCWVPSF